jgi:HEAT repeat protein
MPEAPFDIGDLLQQLEDENEDVRRSSLLTVAKLGEESVPAIRVLQRLASEDRSAQIRYLARKVLRLLAMEAMARAQEQSPAAPGATGPITRKSAKITDALAQESAPVLAAKLNSRHAGVRASALRAAAIRQDPALIPIILERLGPANEPDPQLRALQAGALAILGGRDQMKTVASFLDDPDPYCRAAAVTVLAQYRDVAAFSLVIRSLLDPDPKPQAVARKTLETVGPGNVGKICQLMLRSDRTWSREAAVHCLVEFNLPNALEILEGVLADTDEGVRQKASLGIERLAAMGSASKIQVNPVASTPALREDEHLEEDLNCADPVQRRQTSRNLLTLQGILNPAHLPLLQKRVAVENDPETLVNLITALARLRDSRAVELLGQHTSNHPEAFVRAACADALASIATAEAAAALESMLADRSPIVVGRALVGLKDHPDEFSRRIQLP